MKLALAQPHLTIGDFKQNTETIIKQIKSAIKNNADMIIFPELSTTVKGAKDLLLIPSYITAANNMLNEIVKFSDKITIIVGSIQQNKGELYNTAFLAQKNTVKPVSTASNINNNDLKYFTPKKQNNIFEVCGIKFIVTIGDDNKTSTLADYKIKLNSTYYVKNKTTQLEKKLISINHVGLADNLIYNGGSFATDKNNQLIAITPQLESAIAYLDTTNTKPISQSKQALEENIFDTLSFGFKEFCRINNFKKAVLGLSGGIDSALTAVIMCKAIGAENVLGITMPSKYSTQGSWNDSYKLADNLGMTCITIPIKPLFETFINDVQGKQYCDLAEENLQARLRGNILMSYSNRDNRVLVSTGNKSEAAMGYCTLYGDTCGSINLICDLYKQEVYALSKWINRDEEIIPQNTITKAPSAELRPNQKDQDSLPDYAILDEILYRHIEKSETIEEIAKDFDKQLVSEVINKLNRMEYKRNQLTLCLKISEKALSDRQYPAVNRFQF